MEWMGLWKKKMSIGFCCNIEQKKGKNSWLKWSRDAANNLPMTPKVIWRKSAISSSCVPADTAKIKNYTRKYGRQRKSYNLPYLTKAAVWGEVRMFNLCLCWYLCRCRWSMWCISCDWCRSQVSQSKTFTAIPIRNSCVL